MRSAVMTSILGKRDGVEFMAKKKDKSSLHATALIVFGATGDLTQNKLYPALYELARRDLLPEVFYLYGLARQSMSKSEFKADILTALHQYAGKGLDMKAMRRMLKNLQYIPADLNDRGAYDSLENLIKAEEKRLGHGILRVFYLALPPRLFENVISNVETCRLGKALCTIEKVRSHVIVEKPFGYDLKTARALDRKVKQVFDERQVYRIDHYLGKEALQNIFTFRFSNRFFDDHLNAEHVESIQINALETLGLEGRYSYYDGAGAIRDMVQSHLLQLLAYVAMDEPTELTAEAVHRAKERLLRAVRLWPKGKAMVRGQYRGYRSEPNISRGSATETYVALKFEINNPRWRGVPIYMRTGKEMARKDTSVVITFKNKRPPVFLHKGATSAKNRLSLHIAPAAALSMHVNVNRPGIEDAIDVATMHYCRGEHSTIPPVGDYERLLLDVFHADQTLVASAEEVLQSWRIVQPILDRARREKLFFYKRGVSGPKEADALFPKNDPGWLAPLSGCSMER